MKIIVDRNELLFIYFKKKLSPALAQWFDKRLNQEPNLPFS